MQRPGRLKHIVEVKGWRPKQRKGWRTPRRANIEKCVKARLV